MIYLCTFTPKAVATSKKGFFRLPYFLEANICHRLVLHLAVINMYELVCFSENFNKLMSHVKMLYNKLVYKIWKHFVFLCL